MRPAERQENVDEHTVQRQAEHWIYHRQQQSHHSRVRVLSHIRKLDDAFGQFRVRITCGCGASRECGPAALARIAGASATFAALAPRMRCSKCGVKGAAEVVAVAIPRPRGKGFRR